MSGPRISAKGSYGAAVVVRTQLQKWIQEEGPIAGETGDSEREPYTGELGAPLPSAEEAAARPRRKCGAGRARPGGLHRVAADGAGWAHVSRSSIRERVVEDDGRGAAAGTRVCWCVCHE